MAGKAKGSKTKLKDKKKTSSQTSGTTIKDEILENQDTEPRIGFILGSISNKLMSSVCIKSTIV